MHLQKNQSHQLQCCHKHPAAPQTQKEQNKGDTSGPYSRSNCTTYSGKCERNRRLRKTYAARRQTASGRIPELLEQVFSVSPPTQMKNLPMSTGCVGKWVIASEIAQPTHGRTQTQATSTTRGAQRSLSGRQYYQLFQHILMMNPPYQ